MFIPENAIVLIDELLRHCVEPLPRFQVRGISDQQRQQINYEANVLFLKHFHEFLAKWFRASPDSFYYVVDRQQGLPRLVGDGLPEREFRISLRYWSNRGKEQKIGVGVQMTQDFEQLFIALDYLHTYLNDPSKSTTALWYIGTRLNSLRRYCWISNRKASDISKYGVVRFKPNPGLKGHKASTLTDKAGISVAQARKIKLEETIEVTGKQAAKLLEHNLGTILTTDTNPDSNLPSIFIDMNGLTISIDNMEAESYSQRAIRLVEYMLYEHKDGKQVLLLSDILSHIGTGPNARPRDVIGKNKPVSKLVRNAEHPDRRKRRGLWRLYVNCQLSRATY